MSELLSVACWRSEEDASIEQQVETESDVGLFMFLFLSFTHTQRRRSRSPWLLLCTQCLSRSLSIPPNALCLSRRAYTYIYNNSVSIPPQTANRMVSILLCVCVCMPSEPLQLSLFLYRQTLGRRLLFGERE